MTTLALILTASIAALAVIALRVAGIAVGLPEEVVIGIIAGGCIIAAVCVTGDAARAWQYIASLRWWREDWKD